MDKVIGLVVGVGVGGLVALTFVFGLTPEITATNTSAVSGVSGSLLDMAKWILPVGMIVGVLAFTFAKLKSKGNR